MSDDRAERLRQKRKQSQERAQEGQTPETDNPGEQSKPSKQDKVDKPSKPDKSSELDESEADDQSDEESEISVKEEQVGTYMYLPQSQKKELERLYNILKAEYEYEFDEEFEKNRAFYPLVVEYGLESLDGLDASEIRERLDSL